MFLVFMVNNYIDKIMSLYWKFIILLKIGLGTALKKLEKEGRLHEAANLYKDNLFFKALVENSMQSMCKTYFPLTYYMQKDEVYSDFWNLIFCEFKETERLLLIISN